MSSGPVGPSSVESIACGGLRLPHGRQPFRDQLPLLAGGGKISLEGDEPLGGDRDVGVGGLDLLVQELDLFRRFPETLA